MVKNIIIGIISIIAVVEFVFVAITLNDNYKNELTETNSCESTESVNMIDLGVDTCFDTATLIYESDKQNVYYTGNCYYSVSDGIIKQREYNLVVPRESAIIDYLKTFTDFSQDKSTITCYAMDGTIIYQDLSLPWEKCQFNSLVAYWKGNDNHGYLVQLSPNNVATVSEYLYYSDLQSLLDNNDNDNDNNTDTTN